jgi:hypothetical protein
MKRELYDETGVAVLAEAADLVHADALSSVLDLAGFEAAMILVAIGVLTGVDGSNYVTPILQESDTTADVDFTAVAAADIVGGFTKVDATSEDSLLQRACYVGSKRYIRVKLDYTGTGISAGIVGVYAITSDARSEPAAAPTVTAAT